MGSEDGEPVWQPSSDAQALAQLRSLIRAYIRGELGHSAFVMQFAVQCLTHDVCTPRPPGTFHAADYPLSSMPQPVKTCMNCGHQTNNPSCDCAGCSGDWGHRHYMDTGDDGGDLAESPLE